MTRLANTTTTTNTNNSMAACVGCGVTFRTHSMIQTTLRRRGGRVVYMCEECRRRMASYGADNDAVIGKAKVNPFTFGLELETADTTTKGRAEVLAMQFLPSSDATVDVEYKSGIYNGMNALIKHAATIDALMTSRDIVIDSSCGTHVHVGHKGGLNPETMGYIRRFYHSLFVPLSIEITNTPDGGAALFGRAIGGWACPVNMNSDANNHRNFINVQHAYTLEFRQCVFADYKQFLRAVHFCRKTVEIVVNNFISHFNDSDLDRRRYENITAYRKHKADVAAAKIVKAFKTAYADAVNARD